MNMSWQHDESEFSCPSGSAYCGEIASDKLRLELILPRPDLPELAGLRQDLRQARHWGSGLSARKRSS